MHGLIVNQLRNYTVARYGRPAWIEALRASEVPLPDGPPPLDHIYPDEVAIALVVTLAKLSKTEIRALLEDFGAYLAPVLLRVYEPIIDPAWRTLDVVEHVEERIHTAVRMRDPTAGPPYLTANRRSPTEVDVVYTSARRLCALGEGIVRGLAEHFGEQVVVTQTECMHRGDDRCLIQVQQEPRPA